jgi:hypothetical protein
MYRSRTIVLALLAAAALGAALAAVQQVGVCVLVAVSTGLHTRCPQM